MVTWYDAYLDYEDSRANDYLCRVSHHPHTRQSKVLDMRIHVTNWARWTSAKKMVLFFFIVGFLMAFSIENASIWWGVVGIASCTIGALIMSTIKHHEW